MWRRGRADERPHCANCSEACPSHSQDLFSPPLFASVSIPAACSLTTPLSQRYQISVRPSTAGTGPSVNKPSGRPASQPGSPAPALLSPPVPPATREPSLQSVPVAPSQQNADAIMLHGSCALVHSCPVSKRALLACRRANQCWPSNQSDMGFSAPVVALPGLCLPETKPSLVPPLLYSMTLPFI